MPRPVNLAFQQNTSMVVLMVQTTITQRMREAIKNDARTLNAIAEDAGLPASAVTRLMDGKTVRSPTFDRLAAALGLTLVATDAAPKRGQKKRRPRTTRKKGKVE